MAQSKAQILERAQRAMNRGRVALGLSALEEIPMGHTGNITSCPMAQGLGIRCQVFGNEVAVRSKVHAEKLQTAWTNKWVTQSIRPRKHEKTYKWAVTTPKAIEHFIEAFDEQEIQHLVLDTPKNKVGK